MDTEYYNLFDGCTILLDGYNNIIFNKYNKLYGSIYNKYVKLYFYYYDNNVFNKFFVDYYSLEYILYGFKHIRKRNHYVDFLKYFIINGFILIIWEWLQLFELF